MRTRKIGPLEVSTVGLGCNNFGKRVSQADAYDIVSTAIEAGITLFDTADRYGDGDHPFSGHGQSEVFLGHALRGRREELIVATKFGNPMSDVDPSMRGAGRSWIPRACEASLKRLGTDYIDLYQLHKPDPDVPIAETLGALSELVIEGKVRVVGCSNFSPSQIIEASQVASASDGVRFESVQNEYSMLIREPEAKVLPLCAELDIAFLPYFPLASGLLTGKYRKNQAPPPGSRLESWIPRDHFGQPDDVLDKVEFWEQYAIEAGHSLLELAFAWLLRRPEVASVIAGATSPEQVRANAASSDWMLTSTDADRLESY